jgi:hypothetical protein
MKTLAAALFALSAGLSLNSLALAEPFNDRGRDFTATVQADSGSVRRNVTAISPAFNDRGVDYLADAPAGSPAQEPMISLRDAPAHGWNS